MTSRDTSADTTLDNANMGTREDFEKWAAEEGRSIKRSNPDYAPKPYASAATNNALDGWEARQPEIDALKHRFDEANKLTVEWMGKCAALKAENERLRSQLEHRELSVEEQVARAKENNPDLVHWESNDEKAWDEAMKQDEILRTTSTWANKPFAARFAEVVRRVRAILPEASSPP